MRQETKSKLDGLMQAGRHKHWKMVAYFALIATLIAAAQQGFAALPPTTIAATKYYISVAMLVCVTLSAISFVISRIIWGYKTRPGDLFVGMHGEPYGLWATSGSTGSDSGCDTGSGSSDGGSCGVD